MQGLECNFQQPLAVIDHTTHEVFCSISSANQENTKNLVQCRAFKLISYRTMEWMTRRFHRMLFLCSAAPHPQTPSLSKGIGRGDRRDASTVEGGPNNILSRAPVKESYPTGALRVGVMARLTGIKTEASTHNSAANIFARRLSGKLIPRCLMRHLHCADHARN